MKIKQNYVSLSLDWDGIKPDTSHSLYRLFKWNILELGRGREKGSILNTSNLMMDSFMGEDTESLKCVL